MRSKNHQDLKDNFLKAELETYQACPVSKYFEEIISQVDKLRTDFDVEIIGEVPLNNAYLPVYRIASRNLADKARKILITAGVHGNEAGGVNGALKFLSEDALLLDHDTGIICYPCLNPRGYVLNSRWRGDELHSRTDLNRNFKDQSTLDEVSLFTSSLNAAALRYDVAIDLHETMPDDGVVMAMQYPDRDFDPYEKTPESFYMWEICPDKSKRVGAEVINSLRNQIKVCDWENIFGDNNSGGVIFYPEGAENPDYIGVGPLDSYLHTTVTNHAFTTETYGDISVEERGLIQQNVIRLIVQETNKSSNEVSQSMKLNSEKPPLSDKEKSLLELMTGSVSISGLSPSPVPGWESFLKKRPDQNGLSKLDLYPMQEDDWLRVDESYDQQISLKKKILETNFDTACRLLDGAEEASLELLNEVAGFLANRYSSYFTFDGKVFKDLTSGVEVSFEGLSGLQALSYTGLIAQEDFVLMKVDGGQPLCAGACLCFPSQWEISHKIGKTMMEVHAPVVPLNNMIGSQIDKFLLGLKSWKPMERTSGTITAYNILPFFASMSQHAERPIGTDLNDEGGFKPEKLTLKNERQTFVRLKNSGYLVFGIKVYMSTFAELPANVAGHLHALLLNTPQQFIKDYKHWPEDKYQAVLDYLAEKAKI